MKVRTVLLAALLFAPSASLWAGPPDEDWLLYWLGRDGTEAYLTSKGYSVRGSWALVPTYLEYSRTGNYVIMAEIYDCSTRKYSLLSMTEYDKSDTAVKNYDNPNPAQTFKPFTLSDRQFAIFPGVCRTLEGRPFSKDEMRRYFEDFDKEVRKIRRGQ